MNMKEFLDEIDSAINIKEQLSDDANIFYQELRNKIKPNFTDNGKKILQCMKDNSNDYRGFNAKQIGELLFMSPRSVSGSLRKLINEGYCEKVGTNPITYQLTSLGKTAQLD